MQITLKIEELAQFILGIIVFSTLIYDWWLFPLLLFLPDISMLGYLVNPKVGAISYNLFHHKAVAIAIALFGMYNVDFLIALIGVILFSHASFDRIFGYGLEYPDSFKNTHLGKISNG